MRSNNESILSLRKEEKRNLVDFCDFYHSLSAFKSCVPQFVSRCACVCVCVCVRCVSVCIRSNSLRDKERERERNDILMTRTTPTLAKNSST